MLVRVADKKVVQIANLKKYAYERQGWRQVVEGHKAKKRFTCSCNNPCGYRAFPGVNRIRDLMWSDILKCWRRALNAQGIPHGGPDSEEVWEQMVRDLKVQNRRIREAGFITKSSPVMLLARIPGPIIRALAHDFPNEFSPTLGARSEDINKHLEAVLDNLYINRERGKPLGACLPKGTEGVVLA